MANTGAISEMFRDIVRGFVVSREFEQLQAGDTDAAFLGRGAESHANFQLKESTRMIISSKAMHASAFLTFDQTFPLSCVWRPILRCLPLRLASFAIRSTSAKASHRSGPKYFAMLRASTLTFPRIVASLTSTAPLYCSFVVTAVIYRMSAIHSFLSIMDSAGPSHRKRAGNNDHILLCICEYILYLFLARCGIRKANLPSPSFARRRGHDLDFCPQLAAVYLPSTKISCLITILITSIKPRIVHH